jgi:hypothetical protein
MLICITTGGKRVGINPDNIISVTFNDPTYHMKGGTAKMIDGSTIILDEQAMLNIAAASSIVNKDFKDMYSY